MTLRRSNFMILIFQLQNRKKIGRNGTMTCDSVIEHLITLVCACCHHFTFDDFVPFILQSVGANNAYCLVKTVHPNLVNDNDSQLCCMLYSILQSSTFVCIRMETLILLHSLWQPIFGVIVVFVA